MHLTRVVIIEDSKILATRAHASARSYNSCACLKYIGSGACQLVQSIHLPLTSQRSLLWPRTKEFETLRGFNTIFMQTLYHFFFCLGHKNGRHIMWVNCSNKWWNSVASLVPSTSGIFGKFRELQAEVKRRTPPFPNGQVKSSWQQRCTR